LLAGSWNKTT